MGEGKTSATAVKVKIARFAHGADLPLPEYQSRGAAALDLLAAVDWDHPVSLTPGARALIPTGLMLELPHGYEAQIRPRSGLALKHGVTVLNSPGTIDCDYRGEVKVLLVNLSSVSFEVRRGERIAQLLIAPVSHALLDEVDAKYISITERGDGGFGSTGQGESGKTNKVTKAKPRSARKKKGTSSKKSKPAVKPKCATKTVKASAKTASKIKRRKSSK